MNHANLTARYRPQTFAELAGQETVRAILSRASAANSIAPAYLFSGTRGVGKTTVARIFAKALNCERAPSAEPCNACDNCRQITLGTHVDVVEIDGASNRGIDDVRKLKEIVGYAPMQGRYKVFIIDEAHMLSRDAFNALLKTLEEPPANVTFILATTEPHKFPATIISRCQHYVFKRLPENGLEAHLASVLAREGVPFEEGAVRLLARRAAGSVRDGMSLLGQVLALGGETLTERDTRAVLGLAGQELFFSLFGALRQGNSAELTRMVGGMLDSGLDIGFFLREMALCWRNMFILRQAGDSALSLLDIPAKEADRWMEEASSFDLAHIHAAWQMTIDGQRRVLTSLEPSLALELLLCNIAMLPRLLPLEGVARLGRAGKIPDQGSGSLPAPSTGPALSSPAASPVPNDGGGASAVEPDTPAAPPPSAPPETARETAPQAAPSPMSDPPDVGQDESYLAAMAEDIPPDPGGEPASPEDPTSQAPAGADGTGGAPDDVSWSAFLRFCKRRELAPAFAGMVRTLKGEWQNGTLALTPGSAFGEERLRAPETLALFSALVREYYGAGAAITILPPPRVKTADEIKRAVRDNPAVNLMEKEMGARLIDYGLLSEGE